MTGQRAVSKYSAMSLLVRMHYGDTHLSTGTGFVFYNGYSNFLVTARHNVTGRNQDTGDCLAGHGGVPNRLTVFFNKKGALGDYVEVEVPLFDDDDKPLWREHPMLGAKADIVAIELPDRDDIDFYPYLPSSSYPKIKVTVSERASVIGFPFATSAGGLFAVWVNGFIASEPNLDFGGNPSILIDCRTRTGQSGSPVILYTTSGYTDENENTLFASGEYVRPIGIYSGRINSESDLGIVWKWSVVEQTCRASIGNWQISLTAPLIRVD